MILHRLNAPWWKYGKYKHIIIFLNEQLSSTFFRKEIHEIVAKVKGGPENLVDKISIQDKNKLKMIFLSIGCLIVTICCIIGLVLFNMDPTRYYKVPQFKTQSEGNFLLGFYSAFNLIMFISSLIFAIKSKWNDFLHTIFVLWILYPICTY